MMFRAKRLGEYLEEMAKANAPGAPEYEMAAIKYGAPMDYPVVEDLPEMRAASGGPSDLAVQLRDRMARDAADATDRANAKLIADAAERAIARMGAPYGGQLSGTSKPMVTREQYDRAREVLDALPAGVYLKCSKCGRWQRDGEWALRYRRGDPDVLCERCA